MKIKILIAVLAFLLYAPMSKSEDSTPPLITANVDGLTLPKKATILDEPQPDRLHFTLANTMASRYWGSIVGGIFYSGGGVNFTDFTSTLDDKFGSTYVLLGMINPLDTLKYDHNGGTEYYGGIGRTLNLWKGGPRDIPLVKMNALIMYDAISEIERWNDDVIQEYLRLDFPRIPFAQPYVEGYHWEKSGSKSPPVGFFWRTGVHRDQPLGFSFLNSPMELGIDLSAGYSGGVFGTSSGLAYWRAILSTKIRLSKKLDLIPSVVGQLPGRGQESDRSFVDHSRVFYNLSLRWKFK